MTSLTDIPDDVLFYEMFPRMSLLELVNLKQTNVRFNNLVDRYLNLKLQTGRTFEVVKDLKILSSSDFSNLSNLASKDDTIRAYALIYYLQLLEKEKQPIPVTHAYLKRLDRISSHINSLLPKQITLKFNNDVITENRHFISGMVTAIAVSNLKYKIFFRVTDDGMNDIPMDITKAKRLFAEPSKDNSVLIPGGRHHQVYFDSIDFLSGIKKVYNTNNIPMPKSYKDERDGSIVQIQ